MNKNALYCYSDDNNDEITVDSENEYNGVVVGVGTRYFSELFLPKEEAVKMAKAILEHFSKTTGK